MAESDRQVKYRKEEIDRQEESQRSANKQQRSVGRKQGAVAKAN